MTNVRVNIFDPSLSRLATIDNQAYQQWMHAESAQVDGDVTHFYDVTLAQPNRRPTFVDQVTLPIAPDLAAYQRGGPAPNTLGLYDLILNQGALEAAGVRTPIHVLRTQQLLSMPLLSFGAVLLAAIFAMRSVRHGRRGLWVTLGYVTGANLFFLNDSDQSAWNPKRSASSADDLDFTHCDDPHFIVASQLLRGLIGQRAAHRILTHFAIYLIWF